MRDFRDAKAMAQTLRETLTTKAINISHSESLELVSRMLGLADWNTLSALLQADRRETAAPAPRPQIATAAYPAIPLRDLVPFPRAEYPIFVGREKTIQALNDAFEHQREVVLAVQKQSAVDAPRLEDVHEIGVLAKLFGLEPLEDGTIRVMTRGIQRVLIQSFTMETGAFRAKAIGVDEDQVFDTPDLVRRVVARFESYAAADDLIVPNLWLYFEQTRHPGRIADIIATRMALPLRDKYDLLATLDPVERLHRIEVLLNVPSLPFSPTFEATKRRALNFAALRRHRYATLEHLLLALIEDAQASAVMRGCEVDLDKLKDELTQYLDNELKNIVVETIANVQPTAAFRRVEGRAAILAREVGSSVVTGANALCAIFPEMRSPAARLLIQQGMSRDRMAKALAQGLGRDPG
jgi:ATP-dependent Lon protease